MYLLPNNPVTQTQLGVTRPLGFGILKTRPQIYQNSEVATRGYGEFLFTPSLPLTMRPRRDLLGILVQTHRVDQNALLHHKAI